MISPPLSVEAPYFSLYLPGMPVRAVPGEGWGLEEGGLAIRGHVPGYMSTVGCEPTENWLATDPCLDPRT